MWAWWWTFIIHFFFNFVGWDWVHLVRRPLFGLLCQHRMIYQRGAVGGMRIGRGNRSTRRKPAPLPLSSPKIPHDLTWDRTRRLTAWAMSRPTPSSSVKRRGISLPAERPKLNVLRVHLRKAKHIHKRHPSSRQRGCYIRTMTARVQLQKNLWSLPQRARRQDELIGGKVTLALTLSTGQSWNAG
jgi:hypothetical protein